MSTSPISLTSSPTTTAARPASSPTAVSRSAPSTSTCTGPARLINGDYSGLDDPWDEAACKAVEACLAALGWRVVHPQEYGEEPYEREWHDDDDLPEDGNRTCDPFFGSPDHWPDSGKGDILTYVCHREMP